MKRPGCLLTAPLEGHLCLRNRTGQNPRLSFNCVPPPHPASLPVLLGSSQLWDSSWVPVMPTTFHKRRLVPKLTRVSARRGAPRLALYSLGAIGTAPLLRARPLGVHSLTAVSHLRKQTRACHCPVAAALVEPISPLPLAGCGSPRALSPASSFLSSFPTMTCCLFLRHIGPLLSLNLRSCSPICLESSLRIGQGRLLPGLRVSA